MDIQKFCFKTHGDDNGTLVAIEECKDIPFCVKRVYYMYDTGSDVVRGRHAHKSLQQVLICVHGSCKIKLDDGKETEVFSLNRPDEGIYLANNIWREMFEFSSDAVLMVLASDYYLESDYIRKYDEFLKYVKSQEVITDNVS